MQEDPSFRPEKYKAKVYRECGMSPLVVDLYSDNEAYVAKRVRFTNEGAIEGPWTFESYQQVKSSRDGLGMYVIDRMGQVIGLARDLRYRTRRRDSWFRLDKSRSLTHLLNFYPAQTVTHS